MLKKIYLYFMILSFAVILCGCTMKENKELNAYKLETINLINDYYDSIEKNYTQYSYMFIEHEINNAKELLNKSKTKEEVDFIKENCIYEINHLVLFDDEKNNILKSYPTWEYYFEIDEEPTIKYYLGEYDNRHIVVVKSAFFLLPPNKKYYSIMTVDMKVYFFKPLPEVICVCYNNKFYTLDDATDPEVFGNSVILGDEAADIYERYLLIAES